MRTKDGAGIGAVKEFLARIAAFKTVTAPLTDREYVEHVLNFASDVDAVTAYCAIIFDQRVQVVEDAALHASLVVPQQRARAFLEAMLGEDESVKAQMTEYLKPLAEEAVHQPLYIGSTLTYRRFPVDVDAGVAYGLLLLRDPERPFRADLCRCKYDKCKRFFLAVKPATGRPRRDYCSTEHFDAARAAGGADRVREYRKKLKHKTTKANRKKR